MDDDEKKIDGRCSCNDCVNDRKEQFIRLITLAAGADAKGMIKAEDLLEELSKIIF